MISKRLSDLSSSRDVFEREAPQYSDALKKSGYTDQLTYQEPKSTKGAKRKPRKRNILWFNPPWNDSVSTNIGQKFLNLVDKHFPKGSALHKHFNRNTVKISYCCLPNVGSMISKHNKKLLSKEKIPVKPCNCRTGVDTCPVEGQCRKKNAIYTAEVKTDVSKKLYIGSTETEWKQRFYLHKSSFKHKHMETSTTLAGYIWKLQDQSIPYDITWKIIKTVPSYSPESKQCSLCLAEKVMILYGDRSLLLNKRGEIMNKCRHRAKHKLVSWL